MAPKWIALIIGSLIQVAEAAFTGQGRGKFRKSWVRRTLRDLLDGDGDATSPHGAAPGFETGRLVDEKIQEIYDQRKAGRNPFRITTDAAGELRWTLVADNGEIVGDCSEGYTERRDCEAGIELVRSLVRRMDATPSEPQPETP